jgi:hypothetical protein
MRHGPQEKTEARHGTPRVIRAEETRNAAIGRAVSSSDFRALDRTGTGSSAGGASAARIWHRRRRETIPPQNRLAVNET